LPLPFVNIAIRRAAPTYIFTIGFIFPQTNRCSHLTGMKYFPLLRVWSPPIGRTTLDYVVTLSGNQNYQSMFYFAICGYGTLYAFMQ